MKEQMLKLQQVRDTINAQEHEKPWFIIAGRLLDLSPERIQTEGWEKSYWHPAWGEIEQIYEELKTTVVWHRPDGGEPLADVTDVPENIRIVRFALFGKSIELIKRMGSLSFVKIGYPREWQRCKVYLNGTELPHVIEADAVLGQVVVAVRKNGQLVFEDPDGNVRKQTITGKVTIVVEKEVQTLF